MVIAQFPHLPLPPSTNLTPDAAVGLADLARVSRPSAQSEVLGRVESFLHAFAQMTSGRPVGPAEREATAALTTRVKAMRSALLQPGRDQEQGLGALADDLDAWRRRHLVCRRPWAFDGLQGGASAALQLTRAALCMARHGDLVAQEAQPGRAGEGAPFVLGIDGFIPWLGVAVGLSLFDQLGGRQRASREPPVVQLDASFRVQAIAVAKDLPLQLATLELGTLDGRARGRLWRALYAHLMGRGEQAEAAGIGEAERAQHLKMARQVQAVAWRRNTRMLNEILPAVTSELMAELDDFAPAGRGDARGA